MEKIANTASQVPGGRCDGISVDRVTVFRIQLARRKLTINLLHQLPGTFLPMRWDYHRLLQDIQGMCAAVSGRMPKLPRSIVAAATPFFTWGSAPHLRADNALHVLWRIELRNRYGAGKGSQESVGLGLIAMQSRK